MLSDVERWWNKAKKDLGTAEYLFNGKRYEDASFFCQQSAEKALKAVLLKKKGKIIKIHDLVILAKHVQLDPALTKDCARLTFVYVDTRYPDTGTGRYTTTEVQADIESCRRILQWAEKNI